MALPKSETHPKIQGRAWRTWRGEVSDRLEIPKVSMFFVDRRYKRQLGQSSSYGWLRLPL